MLCQGTFDCKTGISSVVGANFEVATQAPEMLTNNMEIIFS
jgi:hypothetical protein